MGAFDTVFAPKGVTPANTTEATLFTCGTDSVADKDCQANVSISNIGTATAAVRLGILPDGGSVHWILYDDPVSPDNPLIGLGPYYLRSGDAIRIRTDTADIVTFSVTGTNSS